MAGRGCTITVQVLSSSSADEMSLPVALHSPIEVLRGQLEHLTNIPVSKQVLILCDMSDPDRNNDELLDQRNMTLRSLGLKNGSVLTLHSISLEDDSLMSNRKNVLKKMMTPEMDPNLNKLSTRITASQANHSYNGIIFDVKSLDANEIHVTSLHIGGMLGRVRVFVRDRPWQKDNEGQGEARHYWGYSPISRTGWSQVYDKNLHPSWDRPYEIVFDKPLKILPHGRKAIYAHSSLPDDLGIQYQSYERSQIFAKDEHIALVAGLGHTGSDPFDADQGWYKSYRGLAGAISYRKTLKAWNPLEHRLFPNEMKAAIFTMMVAQTCNRLHAAVVSNNHNNNNDDKKETKEDTNMNIQKESEEALEETHETVTEAKVNQLSKLPRHAVLNIISFMHFDWFCIDKTNVAATAEPISPRRSARLQSRSRFGDDNTDEYDNEGEEEEDDYDEDEYEFDSEDDEENDGAPRGYAAFGRRRRSLGGNHIMAILQRMLGMNAAPSPEMLMQVFGVTDASQLQVVDDEDEVEDEDEEDNSDAEEEYQMIEGEEEGEENEGGEDY